MVGRELFQDGSRRPINELAVPVSTERQQGQLDKQADCLANSENPNDIAYGRMDNGTFKMDPPAQGIVLCNPFRRSHSTMTVPRPTHTRPMLIKTCCPKLPPFNRACCCCRET